MFEKIEVSKIGNVFDLIGKDWMLITAGDEEKANTMTAAWGTLGVMWNKNVAMIAVRPERYTYEFIEENEYFTLSFFDKKYKKDLVYLGTKSGRDEDKVRNSNLNLVREKKLSYFQEAKLIIKCKKKFRNEIEKDSFLDGNINSWYDGPNDIGGKHIFYMGEIVEVLTCKDEIVG